MRDIASRFVDSVLGPPMRARQARQTAREVASAHNAIATYWYRRKQNFGDLVTPYLLAKRGFQPVFAQEGDAQLLSTGSILQRTPQAFSGDILGSGLIRPMRLEFQAARIWAVRGPLTAQAISAPAGTAFGDPGLLIADHEPMSAPVAPLGLVVHYADLRDPTLAAFLARHKETVRLIDVRRSPEAVFADICACEHVASSSLHGLIFADAAGRPRIHTQISDRVVGGRFKFEDHDRAMHHVSKPVRLSDVDGPSELIAAARAPSVDARLERQHAIRAAYDACLETIGAPS